MNIGLSIEEMEKIKEVFSRFEQIQEAILYGSRAKGNYRPGSDIDISLKGANLNINTLNNVENQLDNLYLPYKFDISIYSKISNPDLIEHINRVGEVFYKKQNM